METGLIIIFWYGILHAFGPDHLTVIADFSIGKSRRKTVLITSLFALGHGVALFLFAKLLQVYDIPEYVTDYGDLISASVIIMMGVYLLYMVMSDRIQLGRHTHDGIEHIHIWFGKTHEHKSQLAPVSAFGLAALMGIGGVRGMLVTLGMLQSQHIDLVMVVSFILGVSTLFLLFGLLVLYINKTLLQTKKNVRRVFATAGLISVAVGSQMLLA
jgi:ABC-type nickel/cobalt efflux system permease component RcnA